MKKMILFTMAVFFALPTFAQKGNVVKAGAEALTRRLPQQVEAQIARQMLGKIPAVQFAEISNLVGCPLVQVQLLESVSVPGNGLLQARVMGAEELHDILHTPRQMYVPLSFARALPQELYRGVSLDNLGDLETLLKDGIKTDKTRRGNGIFAGSNLPASITYALPEPWETSFPVLMRIKPTDQFLQDNPPAHFKSEWVFFEDIPADMIPDVLVFVKVNGEAGWYKAQLQGGKVVLTGVAGINIAIK